MSEIPIAADAAEVLEPFLQSPEPDLLEYYSQPEANVFPMVPSGAALSEMMFEEE
jgi:thiamine pyrophosphate-dependent acetolactate synthase large subunit-like protein